MLLNLDKSIETYREVFHSGMRSEEIYGRVGKIWKRSKFAVFFFRITNRRHFFRTTRDMQGGRLPIFVYAYGKVFESSDGVTMKAGFWYGLSILELLLFYVIAFLLMYEVSTKYNGIPLALVALCTLGCTLFVELCSLVCSAFTLLGGDDRRELEDFLLRSLEHEEQ